MGKKIKTGKQRKDKYYHLAKEAGYRSRAAFKLIQLNKRFEFLQTSQKLVDLCAAPGGWLQVASQNMPVSSICIGVDLVPIKAVPKCIALQGDIREEKTRQMVRKELQRTDADCVLHDGAPNVGLNWSHDAFQQNVLTLYALRLTTQILKRNGYFVTKIFRSADYQALIAVFEKLFKRVHVWKPAASRLESAEIFVVCEKYLKPAKVDPDLLDVKKVFEQKADEPAVNPIRMLTARKKEKKKKAEGYEDGDLTQFHDLKASEFILGTDPLMLLSQSSCITIDEDRFETSRYTTNELRECIRDIKVCGPAELRNILGWRKKILADIKKEERKEAAKDKPEETEESKEMKELEEIDELIRSAQANEKARTKKKRRQMDKERAKLEERKKYQMVHENDAPMVTEDMELFSLNSIRRLLERRKQIEESVQTKKAERQRLQKEAKVAKDALKEEESEADGIEYDSDDDGGLEEGDGVWETRNGAAANDDDDGDDEKAGDDFLEQNVGDAPEIDSDNDEKEEYNEADALLKQNLIRDEESFMTSTEKANSRSDRWFSKINDLLSDDDEEEENLDAIAKHMKRQVSKTKMHKNTVMFEEESRKRKANRDEDFNVEEEEAKPESAFGGGGLALPGEEDTDDSDDDDCVEDRNGEHPAKKRPKVLTARELAMGELMIYSGKKANNLEEWGWNRYANNDANLPDWFVEDERRHFHKDAPVAKKRVEHYAERDRELNVRPIKKVLEANARKQKRRLKRMAKAKKRAENVLQNDNMEPREKVKEMNKIYKRANKPEKKDVKYQVMSKGKRGTLTRPKGPYRMVDKRLKKDKRGMKTAERRSGGGSSGAKRGGGKPSAGGRHGKSRPRSTAGGSGRTGGGRGGKGGRK